MSLFHYHVDLESPRSAIGETCDAARLLKILSKQSGISLISDQYSEAGSTFLTAKKAGHYLFEMEIVANPFRLANRFTLCHPVQAHAEFAEHLLNVMSKCHLVAGYCDDVPDHLLPLDAKNPATFRSAVLSAMSRKHENWVELFGRSSSPLSTQELYDQIVLPRGKPESQHRLASAN